MTTGRINQVTIRPKRFRAYLRSDLGRSFGWVFRYIRSSVNLDTLTASRVELSPRVIASASVNGIEHLVPRSHTFQFISPRPLGTGIQNLDED